MSVSPARPNVTSAVGPSSNLPGLDAFLTVFERVQKPKQHVLNCLCPFLNDVAAAINPARYPTGTPAQDARDRPDTKSDRPAPGRQASWSTATLR